MKNKKDDDDDDEVYIIQMSIYIVAAKHFLLFLCVHLFWIVCHLLSSYLYFSWCSNYKTWDHIFNSIFYVNHPICVFSLHTIQHSVQIIDSMWVYIALWFSTKIVSSIQWKDTTIHKKLK